MPFVYGGAVGMGANLRAILCQRRVSQLVSFISQSVHRLAVRASSAACEARRFRPSLPLGMCRSLSQAHRYFVAGSYGETLLSSTKPRIRAHLAPFLHASDFGHLCLSKFHRFRIRKNTICNPSAASLLSAKPKTSRFECKPLQVFFCFR